MVRIGTPTVSTVAPTRAALRTAAVSRNATAGRSTCTGSIKARGQQTEDRGQNEDETGSSLLLSSVFRLLISDAMAGATLVRTTLTDVRPPGVRSVNLHRVN